MALLNCSVSKFLMLKELMSGCGLCDVLCDSSFVYSLEPRLSLSFENRESLGLMHSCLQMDKGFY